jgi:hypothetical protein
MPKRTSMEFLCCLAWHPVLDRLRGRASITHELKRALL